MLYGTAGQRVTATNDLTTKQASRRRSDCGAGDPAAETEGDDDHDDAGLPPAAEVEAAIGAAMWRVRRRRSEIDDENENGGEHESGHCDCGEPADGSREHESGRARDCRGDHNDRPKYGIHESQANGSPEVLLSGFSTNSPTQGASTGGS